MRRRRLKKLWKRLGELRRQSNRRDQLMLKLGAAKKDAGRAWFLVEVQIPKSDEELAAHGLTYRLRREKLRQVFRREGRYLLRSNMTSEDPAELWRHYMQLTEIEQAFKELKHHLAIRPIFHQIEERIEAHIFVSFIAYCLLVTLKNLARPQAPGLTPRAIVEKFATLQMVDIHVPTTDGRHLMLPRHTQPNREHELLLRQLNLKLPKQPAPKLSVLKPRSGRSRSRRVVPTFGGPITEQSMPYHLFKCRVGEVGLALRWRKRLSGVRPVTAHGSASAAVTW